MHKECQRQVAIAVILHGVAEDGDDGGRHPLQRSLARVPEWGGRQQGRRHEDDGWRGGKGNGRKNGAATTMTTNMTLMT